MCVRGTVTPQYVCVYVTSIVYICIRGTVTSIVLVWVAYKVSEPSHDTNSYMWLRYQHTSQGIQLVFTDPYPHTEGTDMLAQCKLTQHNLPTVATKRTHCGTKHWLQFIIWTSKYVRLCRSVIQLSWKGNKLRLNVATTITFFCFWSPLTNKDRHLYTHTRCKWMWQKDVNFLHQTMFYWCAIESR